MQKRISRMSDSFEVKKNTNIILRTAMSHEKLDDLTLALH